MFAKILGILDIIAALMFIFAKLGIFKLMVVILALYLIVKALAFISDIASFIDLTSGVYLLLILLGVSPILSLLFFLWLLQKGLISLFA